MAKETENAFPLLVSRVTDKGRRFELVADMSELPMDETFQIVQKNSNENALDLALSMYNKGWTEGADSAQCE